MLSLFLQLIHETPVESQRYDYIEPLVISSLAYLFRLHRLLRSLSLIFVQDGLAQTYLFGCHLDTLILLDIFHAFFQGHLLLRDDPDRIIAAAGTHIGQLLTFRRVDDQVARLDMFRNDLTYINFFAWIYKESTAIL